jgi:hypothetical protein|nr:MAG TPA: hypothetical protein [Caudoviricetes sp.]
MKKYSKKKKATMIDDIAKNMSRCSCQESTSFDYHFHLENGFQLLKDNITRIAGIMALYKYRYNKPFFRAAERRQAEAENDVERREFNFGGVNYSFRFYLQCSCNWNYLRGYYYKNGVRTTFTTVKNLPPKMDELVELANELTYKEAKPINMAFQQAYKRTHGL